MADIKQAQTDNENKNIIQRYKDMGDGTYALVIAADGAGGWGGSTPVSQGELLSLGGALYTVNWTTVLEATDDKLEILYILVANKRPRDIAVFSRWHDGSQPNAAPFVQEGPVWIAEGDVEYLGVGQILKPGDKYDLRNEPADSVDFTIVYRKLV